MDKNEIAQAVRRQMPETRWKHTLGVTETAIRLAHRYGADAGKAELAALMHDYCKYWPAEKQAEVLRASPSLPRELADVLEYDKELWHAPAAAIVAFRDYGIHDREVLDAICYHTTGRADMTKLDKIVCLADYIEPGRDFPGVHTIRELADHSLEKALLAGFDSTIRFLVDRGKKIYPLTVVARNGLVRELEWINEQEANN